MTKWYRKKPVLTTLILSFIVYVLILVLIEVAFIWLGLSRSLTPVISTYVSSIFPMLFLFFLGIAFFVRANNLLNSQKRSACLLNRGIAILLLTISIMGLQGALLLLT